jgi:hypothetical protein
MIFVGDAVNLDLPIDSNKAGNRIGRKMSEINAMTIHKQTISLPVNFFTGATLIYFVLIFSPKKIILCYISYDVVYELKI